MIASKSFDTAAELLEHIRLSSEQWNEAPSDQWLFRGQSNASWPAVPSAWRPLENNGLAPLIRTLNREEYSRNEDEPSELSIWLRAEFVALRDFVIGAEDIGVDTTLSPRQHYRVMEWDNGERVGPFHETATSLAQHHGIPTRYIDFTESSLIAAFFACRGARPHKGNIKIIALNQGGLWKAGWGEGPYLQRTPPIRSKNQFLRIQKGILYQIINGEEFFKKEGRFPSIEDVIEMHNLQHFYRSLILPVSQADTLLGLLDREGVNTVSLMPTLDNLANHIVSSWS